jgi:two-component system sensor histidine kinase ChiS
MGRFVPHPFLQLLDKESVEDLQLGDYTLREMTLLFSDIRAFTAPAESMSAEDTFAFLNAYLAHAGPVIREHHGFIDKYIADAIFALFPDRATNAVDAAVRSLRRRSTRADPHETRVSRCLRRRDCGLFRRPVR